MGEQIINEFSKATTQTRSILLRYFNPVGAHPSILIGEMPIGRPANLVPAITQTAIGKLPQMTVYGDDYPTRDGSCIRDFIHVCDIAHAHTLAMRYMLDGKTAKNAEVYNLGTGNGVTVLEAIRAFEKVSGAKLNYVIGPRRPGDVIAIYANNDLARKQLGWKIEYSLEEMMATAWKWEQKLKADEKFYNGKFSKLN
jgi:UDP-glucose 4-epimerase